MVLNSSLEVVYWSLYQFFQNPFEQNNRSVESENEIEKIKAYFSYIQSQKFLRTCLIN